MNDERKTKKDLIAELEELRRQLGVGHLRLDGHLAGHQLRMSGIGFIPG